jgi:hypothetical protein
MVEHDFCFDDLPLMPFNVWCVQDVISVNEDGVDTSIVLYLASEQHDKKVAVLLDIQAAMLIARDLLSVGLDVGL